MGVKELVAYATRGLEDDALLGLAGPWFSEILHP